MKYFEVTINVFGCINCPYNGPRGCEVEVACNVEFRQELRRENRTQITPSCPMYSKVIKDE